MSWSFSILDDETHHKDMATPVAENTEHSEISTASSDTMKPENHPSLMTNRISQVLNTSIDSKAIEDTKSEGGAEWGTALSMDGLKISNEIVIHKSRAQAPKKVFLPGEILKPIFRLAMTAEDGKFEFTDRVGPFKPNVAIGLLRAK